jgi:anti-sigma factor RsiW
MKPEHQERLQAWVDGELTAAEGQEIDAWVESRPDAQALRNNLLAISKLLRENQPTRVVPESPDFYWSKIRRGIERVEREKSAAPANDAEGARRFSVGRWLAWLLPVSGAALAAFLFLHSPQNPVSAPAAMQRGLEAAMTDHEVDAPCSDLTAVTFYSAQDTTTVVWLGKVDFL